MKLLFKKKGEEFVGRFHEKFPITVKNPITNSRIIGEVQFYKITNEKAQRAAEASAAASGAADSQVVDGAMVPVEGQIEAAQFDSSPVPQTPDKLLTNKIRIP